MADQENKLPKTSNRTGLMALVAAGVMLLVIVGVMLTRGPAGPEISLHQHYPENTGFYIEVAPGEDLVQRFLMFLDRQYDQKNGLSTDARTTEPATPLDPEQSGTQAEPSGEEVTEESPEPEEPSEPSEQAESKEADTGVAIPAETGSAAAGSFQSALIEKFNTTFKPQVSLGVWLQPANGSGEDPETESSETESPKSESLVALPLKEQLSLEALVQRFHSSPSEFTRKSAYGVDYFVNRDNRSTFAIVGNDLLIASTPKAMETVLEHHQENTPDVFENPVNRKYLALLPGNRQGTILINNTVYSEEVSRFGGRRVQRQVAGQTGIYARYMPVTLIALYREGAQLLRLDTYTPFEVGNMKNQALAKGLRAWYRKQGDFQAAVDLPEDTTFFLALNGLDRAFDIYRAQGMSAEQQAGIKGFETVVQDFGLDFREDIVGLLEGEFVMAGRQENKTPIFLIEKNRQKERVLDRLSQVMAGGFKPVESEEERMGDVRARTFSMPASQSRITIGALRSAIGITSAETFPDLAKVKNGKKKSLRQAQRFRNIQGHLPSKGTVKFYVDIARERAQLERQLAKRDGPALSVNVPEYEWLDAMGGVFWVRQYRTGEDLIRGRIILQLRPQLPEPPR